MSFVSWQYAVFLPLVVVLYWRLPRPARVPLLLAASYAFYAFWDVRFVALLLASTAVDYCCGRAVGGDRVRPMPVFLAASLPWVWLLACHWWTGIAPPIPRTALLAAAAFPPLFLVLHELIRRLPAASVGRAFVGLSVATNLGVLAFFKYFGAVASAVLAATGKPDWTLPRIVLPVAISFYTFQSIAYVVDIHRGRARPERNFVTFAAYLSYFPQLVAGPIERPARLLPQFQTPSAWSWENLHAGLRLLLVGVFKKVFVADNCGLVARHAFDPATVLDGPWALLGAAAFAVQVYGDFSGYTDIARGSARLLGVELSENFRFPFLARGPSDFWQRWHITLSTWFRDYVYIPLGGNRDGAAATLRNLWITMLLAGLWHGASWTFVLWGAYHAALLTLYRFCGPLRRLEETAAGRPFRTVLAVAAMTGFSLVGWAIFRSGSLAELGRWFAALGRWHAPAGVPAPGLPAAWLLLHAVPLAALVWFGRRARSESDLGRLPWAARGLVYALLFLGVATSVVSDGEFIYFQF